MGTQQLPDMEISRDTLMQKCEEEMKRIVQFFNEEQELQIAPRAGKENAGAGNNVQRKKIAACLEDSKLPFSILVKEIAEKMSSNGDQVTLASIRTLVLSIGLRVCYGITNTDADVLEDNTATSLWRWEVRELKLLPIAYREEIAERRRRRKRLNERLLDLSSAVEVLKVKPNDVSDEAALAKAREILAKGDDELALLSARVERPSGKPGVANHVDGALKASMSDCTMVTDEGKKKRRRSDPEEKEKIKQERILKRQRMVEEKEQKRKEKEEAEKEKEAEKELKRKEKEEADKKKQEKDAERELRRKEKEEVERKKQEKEAEREQKRKEKEDAEQRKKMALKKQASFMDRFLASKKEPKEQASQEISETNAKVLSGAEEVERKAQHPSSVRDSDTSEVVRCMDALFQSNEDFDLDELWKQHTSTWQETRQQLALGRLPGWGTRRKPKAFVAPAIRLHGAGGDPRASSSPDVSQKKTTAANVTSPTPTASPPKRPRIESDLDALEDVDWKESFSESCPSTPLSDAKKLFSDRYLQLRTKRKKLFQFDKSHRPPYYGTFSKKSALIKPRNPLKQDPMLEYDVDSDEEWEEEEPGESLSDFENEKDEEDERVDNEEEEDSLDDEFMVPDGYLSEGEGVHMEGGAGAAGDDARNGIADHSPSSAKCSSDIAPNGMSREHHRKVLDKATEHALKTNRPLLINNLGWDSEEEVLPATRTEALILEALRIRYLTPSNTGVP